MWMAEWVNRWMAGWVNKWMAGWVNRWMAGWMDASDREGGKLFFSKEEPVYGALDGSG